jgi:hypothetical protein
VDHQNDNDDGPEEVKTRVNWFRWRLARKKGNTPRTEKSKPGKEGRGKGFVREEGEYE